MTRITVIVVVILVKLFFLLKSDLGVKQTDLDARGGFVEHTSDISRKTKCDQSHISLICKLELSMSICSTNWPQRPVYRTNARA